MGFLEALRDFSLKNTTCGVYMTQSLLCGILKTEISKNFEKLRDSIEKYFHLKSTAVYNSSAKNGMVNLFQSRNTRETSIPSVDSVWEISDRFVCEWSGLLAGVAQDIMENTQV